MPARDSTDPLTAADQCSILSHADVVIEGRMPWSSNATFLCELWPQGSRPDAGLAPDEDEEPSTPSVSPGSAPLGRAIYKPHRGERPLWDFPDGLYRREVAAFQLAEAIGWELIPPTVERDGPFGVGSLQWFIDADYEHHHFTLVENDANHAQLQRMCAFDIVANSTDRKAGHVLIDPAGRLWGIDNGLCLHAEFKLRTVIWEFGGSPVPTEIIDDLDSFVGRPLPPELAVLLDPLEQDAVKARARSLMTNGSFPIDETGRRVPWPLV